jgi:tRNA pseudouridine55 synthase
MSPSAVAAIPKVSTGTSAPALCGILLLDKPRGLSSNAALQRVRHLLGKPKAGHTGSLDPLATGMLPICIGEATKLAGALLAGVKGYTVAMRLGERTDTGDAEGQVVERCAIPALNRDLIESALEGLRGPQQQTPPMYSALKRGGEPLYKLARRGLSVERTPRNIEIFVLELLEYTAATVRLRVECSKGTYVRTLVEQLGVRLGSCAHVSALRRDYVEPFRGETMQSLEQLQALASPPTLLTADCAVPHLPAVALSTSQSRAISHGQGVTMPGVGVGPVRLYDACGRFMGLGTGAAGGLLRPLRLFATASIGSVTDCSA